MDMSGLSNHSSFSSEPFLTLEPPLSESDYSFSLGDEKDLLISLILHSEKEQKLIYNASCARMNEMNAVLFLLTIGISTGEMQHQV